MKRETKAAKHKFDPDLRCKNIGCAATWDSHQDNQTPCVGVPPPCPSRRLKVSPEMALEIIAMKANTNRTLNQIGDHFGVSRTLITTALKNGAPA